MKEVKNKNYQSIYFKYYIFIKVFVSWLIVGYFMFVSHLLNISSNLSII